MCIFSGEVKRISNTCIFARLEQSHQYLAYAMAADLPSEMAMILPLPVVQRSELEFIDLSDCPKFFDTLDKVFQGPQPRSARLSLSLTLEVVEVGSFEASYVPTLPDFERLDPRFRLDTTIWAQLPQYTDYGFAVFKLKSGDHEVHPMAFKFETRLTDQLFFPTVHVHDGTVPESEQFDHQLYCQIEGELGVEGWQASEHPLGIYFREPQTTRGLLDIDRIGYKRQLKGEFLNQDVIVPIHPAPKLRPGLRRKAF